MSIVPKLTMYLQLQLNWLLLLAAGFLKQHPSRDSGRVLGWTSLVWLAHLFRVHPFMFKSGARDPDFPDSNSIHAQLL